VHIVYKLLVCIAPYSCMLTQLYNDLLGVKLVNPNENLLRTLDTWQLFAHEDHTHAYRSVIIAAYMQARGLVCYHVACLLCSDVMFQICVCGIMRYFTILIVYCF